MKFRRSDFVEPRLKVHHLDEGYAWVQKMRGFVEDPNEEFSGNRRFQAREASHPCNHASRSMDSSYLGLFSIFGLISGFKMLERVKGLFGRKKAQNLTFFA